MELLESVPVRAEVIVTTYEIDGVADGVSVTTAVSEGVPLYP